MNNYYALRDNPAKRKRKGFYYTCETCSREFYTTPSRVRQNERNGTCIRFCSKACYGTGKTGDGNPMWGKKQTPESIAATRNHPNRRVFDASRDNPNFARWGLEPHVNSTNARWRRKLAEVRGLKCERCGFDAYPNIVQVHHVDRNRKHNVAENLMLLCPNCHEIEHFEAKDGRFSPERGKRKKPQEATS